MSKTPLPTNVVTKAFTWATQELGLNVTQVSEILGISTQTLAKNTLNGFENSAPAYRKQLSFIRMYYLLSAMSKGNTERIHSWFYSYNIAFGSTPSDTCSQYDGLERISDYLRSLKQSDAEEQFSPILSKHKQGDGSALQKTTMH
ncbi:hypothetical protein ACOJR9_17865 [Alteromonas sp. A081]|uniref:hypothetical protein n=1 Tax=Alteromonas sp. A081 TaxID=3410269 RepID=UPI003B985C4F